MILSPDFCHSFCFVKLSENFECSPKWELFCTFLYNKQVFFATGSVVSTCDTKMFMAQREVGHPTPGAHEQNRQHQGNNDTPSASSHINGRGGGGGKPKCCQLHRGYRRFDTQLRSLRLRAASNNSVPVCMTSSSAHGAKADHGLTERNESQT